MMISPWTKEACEALVRMNSEGMSGSQIAAALNCGVSRNAVIGKLHRLGIVSGNPEKRHGSRRASTSDDRRASERARMRELRARRAAVKEILNPEREELEATDIEIDAPADNPRTVSTIEIGECRWPYGDPSGDDFHFCGGRSSFGSSYCVRHRVKGTMARRPSQEPSWAHRRSGISLR